MLSVVALCLCLVAVPALASFPGQNGKIIWYSIGGDQTDNDVFEMKPNGDDQQRLRDDNIDNYDPQVSPNGNRIVWSTFNQLWVMSASGGNANQLSPNSAEDPSWVGNNKIVFMRQGELMLINADGSGVPHFLLNNETVTNEEEPDWSAVTNRIAFVREGAGPDSELFSVKLDGTKVRRLTNNNHYEDDPDWSPKTKRLAFTCRPDDLDNDVCTMSARGKNVVNVTDNALHDDEEASWSPNGMFFVYERETDGEDDDDIWKMKANGDNQIPLTVNDYDDDNPDWQSL